MTPEAQIEAAKLDEANALVDSLRTRTVALNIEIRSRDARIADLEERLAGHEQAASDESDPT